MSKRRVMWLAAAMAAGVLGWAAGMTARGDVVTYTVDPTRSSLTISGTYNGTPISPQFSLPTSGISVTTSYTGTITADRETSSGTLQITGASITANNSGIWTQGIPANYSFNVPYAFDAPAGGISEISVEIRQFAFTISSPNILTPENFDTTLLSAVITLGEVDNAQFPGGNPSSSLSGSLQFASNNGSLTDTGGDETLFIPVETDITVPILGQPTLLRLSGAIVAETPEPASGTMLVLGLPFLLSRRLRKREPLTRKII